MDKLTSLAILFPTAFSVYVLESSTAVLCNLNAYSDPSNEWEILKIDADGSERDILHIDPNGLTDRYTRQPCLTDIGNNADWCSHASDDVSQRIYIENDNAYLDLFSSADSSKYICKFRRLGEKDDEVEFDVRTPVLPEISFETSNDVIVAGVEQELTCSTYGGQPETFVTITSADGRELQEDWSVVSEMENEQIIKFMPTPLDDGLEIECSLVNHAWDLLQSPPTQTKSKTILNVEFAPENVAILTAETETGFNLSCSSLAKPAAKVSWRVNDEEIIEETIEFDPTWSETATVTCVSSNIHGSQEAVQTVGDLKTASNEGGISTIGIIIIAVALLFVVGFGAIMYIKSQKKTEAPQEDSPKEGETKPLTEASPPTDPEAGQ